MEQESFAVLVEDFAELDGLVCVVARRAYFVFAVWIADCFAVVGV